MGDIRNVVACMSHFAFTSKLVSQSHAMIQLISSKNFKVGSVMLKLLEILKTLLLEYFYDILDVYDENLKNHSYF